VFWRFFRKNAAPLAGAPRIRRLKRYSAQSGFVYQYFYDGYRPNGRGVEYVFEVSAGGARWVPLRVWLGGDALEAWEGSHRTLAATERYAIAKMALFQAFDERAHPGEMCGDIVVGAADVAAALETLGIA
jgi:hypothetical protein